MQERLRELQRLEEEQRQKDLAITKAQEEGKLKEYYENLLKEQEQRHKQEKIAFKLKEIEELQK